MCDAILLIKFAPSPCVLKMVCVCIIEFPFSYVTWATHNSIFITILHNNIISLGNSLNVLFPTLIHFIAIMQTLLNRQEFHNHFQKDQPNL